MSDMAELFARDPLNHTRESIDEIIAYYRTVRASFILGEKSAGSTKKAKASGPAKGAKMTSLDLDDLLNKEQ
jgi:hypothetical protein